MLGNSFTAIIVARGGSARVTNKNLRQVAGRSLVAHKIHQLSLSRLITQVVVGSDDDEILEDARHNGAVTVKRQAYYCDEANCTANEMIENMCGLVDGDNIVWAHCTNPMVSSETYDRAVETFQTQWEHGFDSLLSVAELREHLWTAEHKPFNYDPYAPRHVLASQLDTLYKQDGAIFIQPRRQMVENAYFFGKKPYLFVMPPEEVWDVNTEFELEMAKRYLERG